MSMETWDGRRSWISNGVTFNFDIFQMFRTMFGLTNEGTLLNSLYGERIS